MARPARHSDETLIELFLDMLAAERGAGENTLAAYRRDLDDFGEYLVTKRRTVASAATDDVRGYLQSLSKRSFAAASVARRLSAIRQLYRFLYAEGRRGDDPAAIIEGPKRGRRLPKVLGIKEVDRLLATARKAIGTGRTNGERLRAARLNALLELVYATGLRVSELVSLPASAAERNARMLVVRGKGGKERLVPLNDAAKTAMTEYRALMAERGPKNDSTDDEKKPVKAPVVKSKWLFPSFGDSGHLTRQHFARELKTLAAGVGAARRTGEPACAAARLREPPPAQRRGSPHRADAARPRRHLDHADLHACAGGAAEKPGARPPPAGGDLRPTRSIGSTPLPIYCMR